VTVIGVRDARVFRPVGQPMCALRPLWLCRAARAPSARQHTA